MLLRIAVRLRPWRRQTALLQVSRDNRVSQLLLQGLLVSLVLECCESGPWAIAWAIACATFDGGRRVTSLLGQMLLIEPAHFVSAMAAGMKRARASCTRLNEAC